MGIDIAAAEIGGEETSEIQAPTGLGLWVLGFGFGL